MTEPSPASVPVSDGSESAPIAALAPLDSSSPHTYEWDHFRVVRRWGLGVQIGVCRCGKDYASAVHFGWMESSVADY